MYICICVYIHGNLLPILQMTLPFFVLTVALLPETGATDLVLLVTALPQPMAVGKDERRRGDPSRAIFENQGLDITSHIWKYVGLWDFLWDRLVPFEGLL